MSLETEAVVVVAAQSGSELAWRRLFELHFDAVYRFCLMLARGRRELAEETTQQVFVTAAQRIGGFRSVRGSFRAWLLGIARNRYLTLEAGERRRRRREAQAQEEGGNLVDQPEASLLVHDALACLPCQYRGALEDKYLKCLTMKEMAEARETSVEAIESLLRRARDRFASAYEHMRNER